MIADYITLRTAVFQIPYQETIDGPTIMKQVEAPIVERSEDYVIVKYNGEKLAIRTK